MKSFPRQRAILLTLLYCCAAIVNCGAWSARLSMSPVSSSAKIWRAGARSLTSTEEVESTDETSPDDLQAEQELDLQRSLPRLYHTPEVLALNYKEMRENLKVFIYPNSQNASYEYDVSSEELAEGAGSEVRFFNLLAKTATNAFVTNYPKEAHLYFLPVSIDAVATKLGPGGVGHHLRHYLQAIRDNFTFWDESLGSDHFYLGTAKYELFNHRNNLEFAKNAIQVARSPLQPQQVFYPHKDIALPPYHYEGPRSPNPTAVQKRSHLAYVEMQSVLTPSEWTLDGDFVFESADLRHAKFCVTDSIQIVVDLLRSGCVPVLVSDTLFYDLPFQDILNWHEFALVVGKSEMATLKTVLTNMVSETYERMHYLGLQASLHLQWNDPPAAYDAFHMTLFQLWLRRHCIKYARRSDS